jgi:hypothetical protein
MTYIGKDALAPGRTWICPKCQQPDMTLVDVSLEPLSKKWHCGHCGMEGDPMPIITARAMLRQGTLYIAVICPFCGAEHYHSPQPMPDFRCSHCPGKLPTNFDDARWAKYMAQYPMAIKGGVYYIKEVNPGRYEKQVAIYQAIWEARKQRV